MTTITFKLDEAEARQLRLAAQRQHTTVSEFLRRQIRQNLEPVERVRRVRCPHTGALIFKPGKGAPAFTREEVAAMLQDFP